MLFSTPRPVARPLLAQWLAGAVIALAVALPLAVRMASSGDLGSVLSLAAGGLFVPALAVAMGAWTGSGKLFEVCYLLLWYAGPLNRGDPLDFTGVSADAPPPFWIWLAAAALLLSSAAVARAKAART